MNGDRKPDPLKLSGSLAHRTGAQEAAQRPRPAASSGSPGCPRISRGASHSASPSSNSARTLRPGPRIQNDLLPGKKGRVVGGGGVEFDVAFDQCAVDGGMAAGIVSLKVRGHLLDQSRRSVGGRSRQSGQHHPDLTATTTLGDTDPVGGSVALEGQPVYPDFIVDDEGRGFLVAHDIGRVAVVALDVAGREMEGAREDVVAPGVPHEVEGKRALLGQRRVHGPGLSF